ncbi:LysR family transcriptional regulator [Streptomyces sp. NPDC096354]|uniref:LysR family transcriptional regulator n=1 Tax=Streptomyces sp. NPDC096354 TaxID=3366088 RepID=UPI0038224DA3
MNIEALRYVQAVSRTKSFSAAARSYGVTQPTLSNGVARLEKEIGVRLFDRSTRGVRPTAHGAQLLRVIDQILDGLDTLATEAQRLSHPAPSTIRMGVAPLVGPDLVACAFQAARNLARPRDLVLREADRDLLSVDLRAGRLDIILVPVSSELPAFRHRVIAHDPLMMINPSDAGDNSPVELLTAPDAAYIRGPRNCELTEFTTALFERHGLVPRAHAGEADSYRAVDEWAAMGVGAALLPRSKITHEHASCRPLLEAGTPVEFAYEAVWSGDTPLGTEMEEFVTALSDAGEIPSALGFSSNLGR